MLRVGLCPGPPKSTRASLARTEVPAGQPHGQPRCAAVSQGKAGLVSAKPKSCPPPSNATKPESTVLPTMPTVGPWSNAPQVCHCGCPNLCKAAHWKSSHSNRFFPCSKLHALELPCVLLWLEPFWLLSLLSAWLWLMAC